MNSLGYKDSNGRNSLATSPTTTQYLSVDFVNVTERRKVCSVCKSLSIVQVCMNVYYSSTRVLTAANYQVLNYCEAILSI
ncbi:hypothetical protein WN55_03519 [Dufourea novaeangliae]|uniref:Uncharacterized protein n=1 Tax=Dufourea novaeangliae TaxID=178035 RepID=A0A154PKL5_DUFNO|nr:hypothetical protein WN55_03519 [Dufourea novaeangliae]